MSIAAGATVPPHEEHVARSLPNRVTRPSVSRSTSTAGPMAIAPRSRSGHLPAHAPHATQAVASKVIVRGQHAHQFVVVPDDALVAVVPALLGGFVVLVVLRLRHPHPASFRTVHQDLGVVFASVVVALDLVVLVWWIALGGLTSQVLALLVALLLIDTAAAAVLTPARRSISRAWSSGEP